MVHDARAMSDPATTISDPQSDTETPTDSHGRPSPAPADVGTALAGLGASLQPGELRVIGPVAVPGLTPRKIRIYLPKGSAVGAPRLALYLFDGQNLFDDGPSFSGGWHVHETIEHVARRRRA